MTPIRPRHLQDGESVLHSRFLLSSRRVLLTLAFLVPLMLITLVCPILPSSLTPMCAAAEGETFLEIPPGKALLRGWIRDFDSDDPLALANISVFGAGTGTISNSDGSYIINGLEPGEITIHVSYMGYAVNRQKVLLKADRSTLLSFRMEQAVVTTIETIEVRAERRAIDVTQTSTSHTFSAKDLEELITEAPTIDDIVAQQPGITKEGDNLHFRGGRADESLFLVDGVKIKDLLDGQSNGKEISARSASQVAIVTGGFGAKYSQAMSGVVDTKLKEGTRRWHGEFAYDTDLLTDTNELHHIHAEISGPNVPFSSLIKLLGNSNPGVTFFTSISADLSDGYLPGVRNLRGDKKLRTSIGDSFFGNQFTYGSFFAPRASNYWRANFKTAWKVNPTNKITLSLIKSLTFMQDWGAPDIGDINRNSKNFPWAWVQRQDHHYTISKDTAIVSLIWNCSLGRNTSTTFQLSRSFMGKHLDVAGQHWLDYDYRSNESDIGWALDTPYFVDVGDATKYQDQHSIVWNATNRWQYKLGRHSFSMGFSAEYQEVQYFRMQTNSIKVGDNVPAGEERPLGSEFDLFNVTPNIGDIYLEDSFSFEGLTANLGLTFDYWFPGPQVEKALATGTQAHITEALRDKFYDETRELFGHRYKSHISPRVGASFPINDQAHLFFSYGHYSQIPPYYYVYAKSNAQSGEEYPQIGNPTLNPKISVQYEIGTGYELSDVTSFKGTVFWKDMYDYPTTIRLTLDDRSTTRSNFFMYWNMDYARSRGIEFTMQRTTKNYWSGSFGYTYSIAKGKASDPSKSKIIQESGGDSREAELGEEFMWWNRPHKLTARLGLKIRENEKPPVWFGLQLPQDLRLSLFYKIGSGKPYTEVDVFGAPTGERYSKNGPANTTVDLDFHKGFRIAGRRMELALSIYNLFDHRNVSYFDPVTGKPYEVGKGQLTSVTENPANLNLSDEELIAEYVRESQADPEEVNAEGIRKQIVSNMYRFSNPAYRGVPRAIRLGINYEW